MWDSELVMDNNRLSGSIPSTVSGLSSLSLLILDYNALNDVVPATIGALTSLRCVAAPGY